jgi:predicted RNA-binding protein with PIN domain
VTARSRVGDEERPIRWLIDGMNVIGSRPDGWWRDRREAMRRLVRLLHDFGNALGEDLTVVFDGRAFDLDEAGGRPRVVFAPGGRNAADRELLRILRAEPADRFRVVTSDAELAEAARAAGAEVVPSGSFRRRLDELSRHSRGNRS